MVDAQKNTDLLAVVTSHESSAKRNFSPIINSGAINSVTPTVNNSMMNDYKDMRISKPNQQGIRRTLKSPLSKPSIDCNLFINCLYQFCRAQQQSLPVPHFGQSRFVV